MTTSVQADIEPVKEKILLKCHESMEMKEKLFSTYADQIDTTCKDMAERFQQGSKYT